MDLKPKTVSIAMLITLLLPLNSAFPQAFIQYNQSSQAGGASLNYRLSPAEEKAEGSPFYNDDIWRTGTVYTRDNTYTEFKQLKYNAFLDELVFMHNGTPYIVPQKLRIQKFVLGEEEFVGAFNGSTYTFFKVLEKGPRILMIKHIRCIIEKGQPSRGYIAAKPDTYVFKEGIFILKPDNYAVEINPKKGLKILSYIPDKRNEVENYIQSSKLRMKDLEDLTAVIAFYNSLE